MVFGLPSIGESSWGQKILDSINFLKSEQDGRLSNASLTASYVPRRTATVDTPDGVLLGNRASAAGASTRLLFELAKNVANPDKIVMQHYSGYSFYSGTQTGTGSLQGGSDQATAFLQAGATLAGTVVGYEGIAEGNGDKVAGSLPGGVVGLQGTALVGGTPNIPLAVSLTASGVRTSGTYTGTLDEARSLNVQEPTVGTVRRAIYSVGAARFRKGAATKAFEIANIADVLQWSSDGSVLTGHASDGVSRFLELDPTDNGAIRVLSQRFTVGKHVSATYNGAEVFRVAHDGVVALTTTAGLRLVEVGAIDSAGVGYRTLRVSN